MDQAEKLRALIHTAAPAAVACGDVPMVVVTGGRAGVGTTTAALNLAVVLADRGERVLLVDGAQQRNDLTEPAGLRREGERTLSDVLAGKCSAREAIVAGPAGIRLLPNRWRLRSSPDFSRHAQQRLLTELQSLGGEIELVVVDAGRGISTWTRRFWSSAKLIALVTTSDDLALMDAYAAMKLSADDVAELPVRLLVNQASSDAIADDAHRRVDNACRRFLSRSLPALPALPQCSIGFDATQQSVPRVWEIPNSPFGHAARWLGRAVSDLLAGDSAESCARVCDAPDAFAFSSSAA